MKQLPSANRQAEIIKEIEIAEQKARNMTDFSKALASKWESRLIQRLKEDEIKS